LAIIYEVAIIFYFTLKKKNMKTHTRDTKTPSFVIFSILFFIT
jgi:hypothetical protein